MTVKARQCPELRQQMAERCRPGALYDRLPSTYWHPELLRASVDGFSLYWVNSHLCDLLPKAAESLPADTRVPRSVLLAPRGLCFFETGLELVAMSDQSVPVVAGSTVIAMSWTLFGRPRPYNGKMLYPKDGFFDEWDGTKAEAAERDPWTSIRIDFFSWAPTTGIVPMGGSEWAYDTPLERFDDVLADGNSLDEFDKASLLEDRRLFAALHSLIASPGVIEMEDIPPDRPTVRRLQRKGVIDPASTRVIYLRGSRRSDSSHAGEGSSRYHHRWIVSGHWRSQPYGPGNTYRKVIWVKPHVKGPADAPLLAGEVVRALT